MHWQERLVGTVARWGAFGTLIIRAVYSADQMKRPQAFMHVQHFLAQHNVRGAAVLAAYSDVNPYRK